MRKLSIIILLLTIAFNGYSQFGLFKNVPDSSLVNIKPVPDDKVEKLVEDKGYDGFKISNYLKGYIRYKDSDHEYAKPYKFNNGEVYDDMAEHNDPFNSNSLLISQFSNVDDKDINAVGINLNNHNFYYGSPSYNEDTTILVYKLNSEYKEYYLPIKELKDPEVFVYKYYDLLKKSLPDTIRYLYVKNPDRFSEYWSKRQFYKLDSGFDKYEITDFVLNYDEKTGIKDFYYLIEGKDTTYEYNYKEFIRDDYVLKFDKWYFQQNFSRFIAKEGENSNLCRLGEESFQRRINDKKEELQKIIEREKAEQIKQAKIEDKKQELYNKYGKEKVKAALMGDIKVGFDKKLFSIAVQKYNVLKSYKNKSSVYYFQLQSMINNDYYIEVWIENNEVTHINKEHF